MDIEESVGLIGMGDGCAVGVVWDAFVCPKRWIRLAASMKLPRAIGRLIRIWEYNVGSASLIKNFIDLGRGFLALKIKFPHKARRKPLIDVAIGKFAYENPTGTDCPGQKFLLVHTLEA